MPFSARSCAIDIDVPAKAAPTAFPINPSFPNLAFEFASLINFATTSLTDSSPNQFSINLINEIYKRTGGQPVIRLGGTSGDFYTYIPSQIEPVIPVPEEGAGQLDWNTTIGPSFWGLTSKLAATGAVWIPQVSIGNNDIEQVVEQARAIADGIGWDKIHSLEIGNEVDLFPCGGVSRPGFADSLNNDEYADRFKRYAKAISEAISLPCKRIFLAGDFSCNMADHNKNPLNVPAIFKAGIDDDGIVKEVAGHYYQISTNDIPAVMNHATTVRQFASQKSWRDHLAETRGVPYCLDEASVYSGPPPNNLAFRSCLGAALWRTDFLLYTMSNGIERVHWESVFCSGQATWQPQGSGSLKPENRSGWYSLLVAADFIGRSTDGHRIKVDQIEVDGRIDNEHFTAYAAYEGDEIVRLAFVNLKYWDEDQGERREVQVNLSGLDRIGKAVSKTFTSARGAPAATRDITYGGSQWTYESMGLEVVKKEDTVTAQVMKGAVRIVVPDSSAVVVHLALA